MPTAGDRIMTPALSVAILGSRGYPSSYGGFETFVRRFAPYLVAHGHSATVYSRRDGLGHKGIWGNEMIDGVTRLVTPGIGSPSLSTLSHGLTASIDTLWRAYDIVLVLNAANGVYLPLLRLRRRRILVNPDGLEWARGKWGPLAHRIFLFGAATVAKRADHVIADSEAIAEYWRAVFGRSSQFIPYGADVLGVRSEKRITELNLRPRSYVLVVARLVPENNLDLILRGMRALDQDTPIVVVGSTGRGVQDLGGWDRKFEDVNIRWLGHVSDEELLLDLWAHCGVYLHGHSVGGTNPALLQALGAGSPTLAFDTPFNREVLQDGAQLFGPAPEELADKTREVLRDRQLQSVLSEKGQERIRSAYTWDRVCGDYLSAMFSAVVGDSAGPLAAPTGSVPE